MIWTLQLFVTAVRLLALGAASVYHFYKGFKVLWYMPMPAEPVPTVGSLIIQVIIALQGQWLYCLVCVLLMYAWRHDTIKLWREAELFIANCRSKKASAVPSEKSPK